jgi:hypothetical protein
LTTGHLRLKNLLNGALDQIAEKVLSAQTVLPSRYHSNTLFLASHLLPPWKCRLVNNILRNEMGGSLTLATLTLLQNFTGLIVFGSKLLVQTVGIVRNPSIRIGKGCGAGDFAHRQEFMQRIRPANSLQQPPDAVSGRQISPPASLQDTVPPWPEKIGSGKPGNLSISAL